MGWFDKKSWRLRRKIKDLQADLRAAEREGRYVLEDGLFFAELPDMGEMTMVVFGATDVLSAQEESVIRDFFERNGFIVHKLKIDRSGTHLAEAEVIPPAELVRHIARRLKSLGYRVLDDTAKETPSDVARQVITLSSLIRGVVIHFCDRVTKLIARTHLKMNKEGNRLLHWLPRISEVLRAKLSPEVLEILAAPFAEAYAEFYGALGSSKQEVVNVSSSQTARIPSIQFSAQQKTREEPPALKLQNEQRDHIDDSAEPKAEPKKDNIVPFHVKAADSVRAPLPKAASEWDQHEIERLGKELEAAETLARMYRRLIRAQPSRCVRNSEGILEEINKLFRATATCILVKVPHGHGVTIHAQAGKKLVWGEGGKDGFAISNSIVADVIRNRKAAVSNTSSNDPSESMILHGIESVAAAPVFFNNEIVGILYVDRREGIQPFSPDDVRILEKLAKVFEEFPDLTLGLL